MNRESAVEMEKTARDPSVSSFEAGAVPSRPAKSTRARTRYQKLYNAFGFTKAYNFPLFIIFGGAMFGFSLQSLDLYNFDGIFPTKTFPGDWFWLSKGHWRIGMLMHLGGCIPAGLLMGLQFVPVIRHRYLIFHRINGYFVLSCLLVANAGAGMITRRGGGGDIALQMVDAVLIILTTIGMAMAYYNVKRLQIDQHRAWMLRTMFYFGAVLSSRIFTDIAAPIIGRVGEYYRVWSCEELSFIYKQFGFPAVFAAKYPQCLQPNGTLDGQVVVKAAYNLLAPEELGSAFFFAFPGALWISALLHIIGVEIYISLTPKEGARLRQVSYEKQLEAGFSNPGFAGLTVNRFGDAEEWVPRSLHVAADQSAL